MAKAVVAWCDICMERDDTQVAGEEVVVTIGNMKPRALDLCDRHMKEVVTPLKDLLQGLGQKLPEQATAPRETRAGSRTTLPIAGAPSIACQYPDCRGYGPYRHTASLRSHVRSEHGINWPEYLQTLDDANIEFVGERISDGDEQLPMDSEDRDLRFVCEVCGTYYDPEKYKRPAQAIGLHRRQAHGIAGNKNPAPARV